MSTGDDHPPGMRPARGPEKTLPTMTTTPATPSTPERAPAAFGTRQAAFVGLAAMVGAGIFSLLGAAGEVAGSAVWLSFLLAGLVAGLQGYSFARFGARFPSAGGLLEYVARAYGNGHVTGIVAWLLLGTNAIITGMVAVSFGSYAADVLGDGDETLAKVCAIVLVAAMTALNAIGSEAVARTQTAVVAVVLGTLGIFAVATLAQADFDLLAPSGYPGVREIVSSIALTFFAFLGFGVITFTVKDLADPPRQLPRAIYLALAGATAIYVAVALGVFGTLTVDEVIASGGTALAVAAEPALGRAGYWMMTVTALFATAGATNSGLYPAAGLADQMVTIGQFPPALERRLGGRIPAGVAITAALAAILALGFDLGAIASLGSAVALIVFTMVTAGHLRARHETGARALVLVLGVLTTGGVFATFAVTTLADEPATAVALVVVVAVSVALDLAWKRAAARQDRAVA
jgi:amino acid transporter